MIFVVFNYRNIVSAIFSDIENNDHLMLNTARSSLSVAIDTLLKNNKDIKIIAVGDNYNDLEMLKLSDFPCLVFNDKFTLEEIPIDNLITTDKSSPEGWADVIKTALDKLNYKD